MPRNNNANNMNQRPDPGAPAAAPACAQARARTSTRARVHACAAVLAIALTGCATPQASAPAAGAADPIAVYAAGSLRQALTEIASAHEARTGTRLALTFGASGLLRARIEQGAAAQLFASANTEHPARLAARGGWQAPVVFTRNSLCALTSEEIDATPETLLATLLRADVRLGTSTPGADPAGDYAWQLFRKADALQAGAWARLDAKVLKLTGGPGAPEAPPGRPVYVWLMEQRRADVLLTYCTNAHATQAALPRLRVLELPAALQVGANYALTLRSDAPPAAAAFAQALREPAAQAVFRRLGFGAP